MVKIYRPNSQRYTKAKHTGDFMLEPKGIISISQEIIPVIGPWEDFTGSGGVPTKQLMSLPRPNELLYTNAWLEGMSKDEINILGTRVGTTRLRQKKVLID